MTQSQPGRPGDEWGSADLDLDAYLERIGQTRSEPSITALHALHQAHVRTIPFENLDPAIGRSPRLDLGSITAKLVRRSRGGYCYEHGLLFAAALECLGYEVSRRASRVYPDSTGARTHMNVVVRIEGSDFLADVGFGASIMHPMPLRDGTVVDQAGWKHRLTRAAGEWRLEAETEQGWTAVQAIGDEPQRPVDYEIGNHYVATHPDSPFTGQLIVKRLDHGLSRKLVGHQLHHDHADGRQEHFPVPPARLEEVLHDLGVEPTSDELDALRQL
ncbi:arylamine N-acetyltransferase [Saccharomonospora marina XMU15]|uniref:Arylamine N-acetyltransferase n=1 Tax=Saccharomonospora marina XMU15 TaxID=882083 RepID=H5X4P2_9PSEU|nr:arylamine N-acetyltransferase [Saccharomonospora marina]EHR51118.1 arylamine N-acetyltransferase [Saccharomonospora marina XMU15]